MQRSHFTLHGALFGAVILALLGAVACAIDEAAPADEGKKGGLPSQLGVASDATTLDLDTEAMINGRIILDSETASVDERASSVVQDYARRMVEAHKDALDRSNRLFRECLPPLSAMSPAFSIQETSTFLPAADALTVSLQYASAENFDRTYIDGQIERHEAIIERIQERMQRNQSMTGQYLPQKQALGAESGCEEKFREMDARNLAEWDCHLAEAKRIRPSL
jgi:predicted outer membrane protein